MHAYIDRVIELTTYDVAVRKQWLAIFQMLESPSKLFQPTNVFKVLRSLIVPPRAAHQDSQWPKAKRAPHGILDRKS